jgi:putative FmdB family regulatory protein
MPIYAYRCDSCGHAKDVIQKFSDAPLTTCPECGADAFRKQLTAPAFQLKGSGWYVTDFRDNGKKAAKPDAAPAEAKADAKSDAAASGDAAPAKAAEPAAAPAAAPAPSAPKAAPET